MSLNATAVGLDTSTDTSTHMHSSLMIMLSSLITPAASYIYGYPPTMQVVRSVSPFERLIYDRALVARSLLSPSWMGTSLLDSAPSMPTFASLVRALDLDLDIPRRPSWVETDDEALAMSFIVPARDLGDIAVEAFDGSLVLTAKGGDEGARQWISSYSVSLPFDVRDATSVEAFFDADNSILTLRVPKSAAVQAPQRVQLEIKTSSSALVEREVAQAVKSEASDKDAQSDTDALQEKFSFIKESKAAKPEEELHVQDEPEL